MKGEKFLYAAEDRADEKVKKRGRTTRVSLIKIQDNPGS
jgi:hypothetical protein